MYKRRFVKFQVFHWKLHEHEITYMFENWTNHNGNAEVENALEIDEIYAEREGIGAAFEKD